VGSELGKSIIVGGNDSVALKDGDIVEERLLLLLASIGVQHTRRPEDRKC